jgi:hypothetical protein
MLATVSIQAGRPVATQPTPAVPSTPSIQVLDAEQVEATTEASVSMLDHAPAMLFILGMSSLLLLPVFIELVAPSTFSQLLTRRHEVMARRVLP